MLVCTHCGRTIETCKTGYVIESHGERHCNPYCRCGGKFVPATKCKVCGVWFDNEGLHGVCEECLESYETVGDALAFGDERFTNVEVNSFIANVLTQEQINSILGKWVEEHFTDHCEKVVEYLENDKSEFSDYIVEKVGD